MTKKILVSLFAILVSAAAYAATKGVALGPTTTCRSNYTGNSSYNAEPGQSDWGASCTAANGSTINVRGVGLCGSDAGVSSGTAVDSVQVSGAVESNQFCYCKIFQPVVSRWVFAKKHEQSAGDCAYWCQNTCADYMNKYLFFYIS